MTHDALLDDHRPDPDLSWLLVPVAPPAGGAAAARAGHGRVLSAPDSETPGARPERRRPTRDAAPGRPRPAPTAGRRSAAIDPLGLEGLPDYLAPGPGSTGGLDPGPEPPASAAEDDALTGSPVPPAPISLRAPRDRGFWIATAALVAALAGFGWAGHLALGLRTTEHRIGALAAEVRVLQEDDHDRAVARLRAQMQNGWIVAEASGARPGVAVPDELWIRWDDQATFWKVPMDDRGWIEAYDAPAGELVGYLLPDSTFVPLEEADGSAVPVTGS